MSFTPIEDPVSKPPTKPALSTEPAKPKKLEISDTTSAVIKYLIIAVVAILIVGLIVYFIVRSSREQLNNTRKELELIRRSETALKQRAQSSDERIRKLMTENHDLEFQLQEERNRQPPSPDDYDTSDVDSPKTDPRIAEKEKVRTMVNAPRTTVDDIQKEKQQQLDEIQAADDATADLNPVVNENDRMDAIFTSLNDGGELIDE